MAKRMAKKVPWGPIAAAAAVGGGLFFLMRSSAQAGGDKTAADAGTGAPPSAPPPATPTTPLTSSQADSLLAQAQRFKYMTREQKLAFVARLTVPASVTTDDAKIIWATGAVDRIMLLSKTGVAGMTISSIVAAIGRTVQSGLSYAGQATGSTIAFITQLMSA